MKILIIHYSEIATKGKNRLFFEGALMRNLRKALGKDVKSVSRRHGLIACDLMGKPDTGKIAEILKRLPGIAHFSFAERSALRMDGMKKLSLSMLRNEEFESFRVSAKRSYKEFKKTSREVNEILGEHIIRNLGKKAKMKDPDLELFVEIGEKEAFIYSRKFRGIGGLPVGTAGKLVSSLSGGIDSPVASALMMKRGCSIVFVHICNKSLGSEGVLGKINSLVKQLTKVQLSSKLYVVPFDDIQKEIIMSIPSRYRMIVYRRFMMRIITRIAGMERAKGIVTGDSVGQVASQTLDNLGCIHNAAGLPVFSPLIGMNKEEIVDLARGLGTYEHSIVPYPDCCSYNIAQHPETRARLEEIELLERSIKSGDKLVEKAVSGVRTRVFGFP